MQLIRTARYIRAVGTLKASASDVEAMELAILANPQIGALIQGLKGIRKARFRIGNRGKSSGGRSIYYVMTRKNAVLMITCYAKADKEDLSPDDRKSILRALEDFIQ